MTPQDQQRLSDLKMVYAYYLTEDYNVNDSGEGKPLFSTGNDDIEGVIRIECYLDLVAEERYGLKIEIKDSEDNEIALTNTIYVDDVLQETDDYAFNFEIEDDPLASETLHVRARFEGLIKNPENYSLGVSVFSYSGNSVDPDIITIYSDKSYLIITKFD